MSSSPGSSPPTFLTLPLELQTLILSHAGLAPVSPSSALHDGIVISYDFPNKRFCREAYACPYGSSSHVSSAIPTALFRVCRRISADSLDVFYRRNRFILDCWYPQGLAFLTTVPSSSLALIRRLDLRFGLLTMGHYMVNTLRVASEVGPLLKYIAQNLDVPNLDLTIDTGPNYEIHYQDPEFEWDDDDMTVLKDAYLAFAKELEQIRGVRNLEVYHACFHEIEDQTEKAILGEDAVRQRDQGKKSKTRAEQRDWEFPHRRPEEIPKERRGMNLRMKGVIVENEDPAASVSG